MSPKPYDDMIVSKGFRAQTLSLKGLDEVDLFSTLDGLAECLVIGNFSNVAKTSDICGLNLASLIHCNARTAAEQAAL